MKEFVELLGLNTHYGGLSHRSVFHRAISIAIFSAAVPVRLPDPALEHPEFLFLDGEFNVEHVCIVLLELGTNSVEFLYRSRA